MPPVSTSAHETLAFVARTVDYGESDRVVTLLTERMGKVTALARGARRSRRRFGAALDLFICGNAALRPRRGAGSMPLLERFESVENLATGIARDVAKIAHGSYMLEVTRELWPAEQSERAIFALLLAGLRTLAASAATPALLRCFELQLLAASGLSPSLDRCARCGGPVEQGPDYGFSVTQGGVICPSCGPHGWPLAAGTHSALLRLGRSSLADATREPIDPQISADVRDLMLMTMSHHTGKRLQSVDFIASLNSAPR